MHIKQLYADNHHAFQEADYTCGPVTLLNALRLKGDLSHTEEELSKLCRAKPGIGTLEEDMIKTAKQVGLEVVKAKAHGTLKELEQYIDDGAFVIVCYFHAFSADGHFAMIAEYDDKAYYFDDCSLGYMRLTKKDFEKHWHSTDNSVKRWFMAVK